MSMRPFLGYLFTLAACIGIEAGIFYGLVGLGSTGETIVWIEMIWLCVTVVLTLLIGGRFYPEGGDDSGD